MPLGHKRPFANYFNGRHEIWMFGDSPYKSYLHELGHLMGIEDHYVNKFPYHGISGYNCEMTIMCHSKDFLRPSDIEAIQYLYCTKWPGSQECRKFSV